MPEFHPPALRTAFDSALQPSGIPHSIAIVGAGAAGLYTVRELLRRSGSVRITVFEQRGEVGGLLRTAVSRAHQAVPEMVDYLGPSLRDDRVELVRTTRIGHDISVARLRSSYDAVILACGASQPRRVDGLPPHSDRVHQAIDLLSEHSESESDHRPADRLGSVCVIIGAGNVAMDAVRRIVERNRTATDGSRVTDIFVISRSPASRPAFTFSSLQELRSMADIELLIDPGSDDSAGVDEILSDLPVSRDADARSGSLTQDHDNTLRIVLCFDRTVIEFVEIDGKIMCVMADARHSLCADSVVMAVGFLPAQLDGIPLDDGLRVLNRRGRILSPQTGEPQPGLYVVGWAKRGAVGGVGENCRCAAETVEQLVADLSAAPCRPRPDVVSLAPTRPDVRSDLPTDCRALPSCRSAIDRWDSGP